MAKKIKKIKQSKDSLSLESYKEDKPLTGKSGWKSQLLSVKNIILLVLLLVVVSLWRFKGYFIAATVNGQPISRWQLNNQLEKRFGGQVLDNIINERLILSATRQKSIFVSSSDIDKKVSEVKNQLQGKVSLDEALKSQGMTLDDFRKQLEIQLAIDQMFNTEASISSKDVDDYIANNESAYKDATDPAALRSDVESIIKQQKIADLFNNWFTDIRKNAKISKFL